MCESSLIEYAKPNDVVCSTNMRGPGNQFYRNLISINKAHYGKASQDGKMDLAKEIVRLVHENGGRFLKRRERWGDNGWYEMDCESSVKKALFAMRDCRTTKVTKDNPKKKPMSEDGEAQRVRKRRHVMEENTVVDTDQPGQSLEKSLFRAKKKSKEATYCVKITTVSEKPEMIISVVGILSFLCINRTPPGKQDFSLDLLSELVNSPTPIWDPTTVNGFEAKDHIDFEFIHKDKRGIPTKAKVIEVDEETGKVMLEYVHGGLESVEPNIIQDALLSKDQGDEGDGMWTFSKILSHRTVENGKVEVEVLWDNGETSWEPLAELKKDDPVTIAAYAKEQKLLEQRGWKWAKSIARREKS
mmetsp:Transcript_1296/g.1575  ORF Transcript_1296/g.1575 Transcript_1296/m.1575 type:complete len:358 (+) Transcript_1296:276-1349(+)